MVNRGRVTLKSRMSVARDNKSEGKEDMPWRGADNLGIDDDDDDGGRPRRSADADESCKEGRGGNDDKKNPNLYGEGQNRRRLRCVMCLMFFASRLPSQQQFLLSLLLP